MQINSGNPENPKPPMCGRRVLTNVKGRNNGSIYRGTSTYILFDCNPQKAYVDCTLCFEEAIFLGAFLTEIP